MFDKIRAAWLNRKADGINVGQVTAAEFLRNLGLDETDVKRVRSAFGTKVRKLYEVKHGQKPAKTGAEVVKMGKKSVLVATYAYRRDELSLLIEATFTTKSVRELVGA